MYKRWTVNRDLGHMTAKTRARSIFRYLKSEKTVFSGWTYLYKRGMKYLVPCRFMIDPDSWQGKNVSVDVFVDVKHFPFSKNGFRADFIKCHSYFKPGKLSLVYYDTIVKRGWRYVHGHSVYFGEEVWFTKEAALNFRNINFIGRR